MKFSSPNIFDNTVTDTLTLTPNVSPKSIEFQFGNTSHRVVLDVSQLDQLHEELGQWLAHNSNRASRPVVGRL